jgi:copper(I)-binding protein
MHPVDGVDLPAGDELELKPGGLHIMLIGLEAGIETGR